MEDYIEGYKVIYNINTCEIIEVISNNQILEEYYIHYSDDFKQSISSISVDTPLKNLNKYKVVSGIIVDRPFEEIEELRIYKRLLTDDERIIDKMKPSREEINDAEQTLKILELLQEVL